MFFHTFTIFILSTRLWFMIFFLLNNHFVRYHNKFHENTTWKWKQITKNLAMLSSQTSKNIYSRWVIELKNICTRLIDSRSGNITKKKISNAQIKENWRTSCRRRKKIAKSIQYVCQVKYIILTEYQCDTLSQRSQICMWNSKINDRCHDCICLILYRNRLRYNPHNGSIWNVASASCSRIKNKNWTFRETSRHL